MTIEVDALGDVTPAEMEIGLLGEHMQAARSALSVRADAPAQETGETEHRERRQPDELTDHRSQREHEQVARQADECESREQQNGSESGDLNRERSVAAQAGDEVACVDNAEGRIEAVPELSGSARGRVRDDPRWTRRRASLRHQ